MNCTDATTRGRILDAAQAEFLEKGYRAASLRTITKNAGVTTGALYGYFKSKEELFEALAGPICRELTGIFRNVLHKFHRLPMEQQHRDMINYTAEGMERMVDCLYADPLGAKLLLCCAQGTRYEHFIEDFIQMEVDATDRFIQDSDEAGMPLNPIHPTLYRALTTGMFSNFFELIVRDVPRGQAEEYIRQLLAFYYGGWSAIMGL